MGSGKVAPASAAVGSDFIELNGHLVRLMEGVYDQMYPIVCPFSRSTKQFLSNFNANRIERLEQWLTAGKKNSGGLPSKMGPPLLVNVA
jgi:hypothetical protein